MWRTFTTTAKREVERRDLLISRWSSWDSISCTSENDVPDTAEKAYADLQALIGLMLCDFPFPAIALKAVECG
jgi:hypothetical protein